MSDYGVLFDARGDHAHRANRDFPSARRDEADRRLGILALTPGRPWFDLGAGGVLGHGVRLGGGLTLP